MTEYKSNRESVLWLEPMHDALFKKIIPRLVLVSTHTYLQQSVLRVWRHCTKIATFAELSTQPYEGSKETFKPSFGDFRGLK